MRKWLKVAVPLAIAAVLVSVLAIGFGSPSGLAAPGDNGRGGGNHVAPTLALVPNPHADVGQHVAIMGEGFPKDAAVFVVVNQVAPVHTAFPSILVQADGSGSFETGTSFSDPGTYSFSACFYQKKGGGSWDCGSVTPQSLEVTE